MVAGKGAIDPFATWSGGLARANGKSHADGIVLPPQCGGGGEWDNSSINIWANMVLIWANLWGILAQEVWGREFSVMVSENGAVEQYDDVTYSVMASENGAVEQYNNIAGANSIGGTAVGQYPLPHGGGGGRRICRAPRLM